MAKEDKQEKPLSHKEVIAKRRARYKQAEKKSLGQKQ